VIDEPARFPAWRRISDTASLIYERPLSQSDGLTALERAIGAFGAAANLAQRRRGRHPCYCTLGQLRRDGLVQTQDPGW